jgi:hypothetical protein
VAHLCQIGQFDRVFDVAITSDDQELYASRENDDESGDG